MEDNSSVTTASASDTFASETEDDIEEEPKVTWRTFFSILLGLTLSATYGVGLYVMMVSGRGENDCQMTYMYEYPEYISIGVSSPVINGTEHYSLYVYGEGKISQKLRKGKFTGIPVLFVPGNSGSYKQVRSLASIALRKALEDGYKTHFDYFAVDFDEELSAVYGGVLQPESSFTAQCVKRILDLYSKAKHPPSSVILVGHSIGGMVAKAIFMEPNFDPSTVSVIVTLATPHNPVVFMDRLTAIFYENVNEFWNSNSAPKVPLISVGGGDRDVQVRGGLTFSKHADVNVVSTAIPGAWVSADHRCIVWCKQIILAISRSLFDLVDAQSRQIIKDGELIKEVFDYHLVRRSAGKTFQKVDTRHPEVFKFDKDGYWSDIIKRQYTFERGNVTCNTYIMVRIIDDPKHQRITFDAVNMDNENWVFACNASTVYKSTRMCETGINLSQKSYILPSNGKRKTITLDARDLAEFSHIVVFAPMHLKGVKVIVDVFNPNDRFFTKQLPSISSTEILEKSSLRSVYYKFFLPQLEQPWQAYKIRVNPLCDVEKIKNHFGIVRFVNPWHHSSTQSLIGYNMSNELSLKLQTPRMSTKTSPYVEVYLNPQCSHSIGLEVDYTEIFGQLARYYSPMAVPCFISCLVITMAYQTAEIEAGQAKNFLRVLLVSVAPLVVILPSRILSFAASVAFGLDSDYLIIEKSNVSFALLPLLMFLSAKGMVLIMSSAAWFCVLVFGNLVYRSVVRFVISNDNLADIAVAGISKFPIILAMTLAVVSISSCGALGLTIGTFFTFLHLFSMYKDHLETMVKNSIGVTETKIPMNLTPVNVQFTNFLLWLSVTILNAPSLVMWTKNMSRLQDDPSLLPGLIMIICLPFLWGERYPNVNISGYKRLSQFQHFIAVLIPAFGFVSIYRVNFFVCILFIANAAHQILGPKKEKGAVKLD